MKRKCVKLIKVLLDHDNWMTASYLASELNVSKRSIKNYIAEINYHENGLITSSRKGYSIDSSRAKKVLDNSNINLPQNSKERVNYIITSIIINDASEDKKTDLYELGNEIFVSYETIKKDMVKVKNRLIEFDLHIVSNNAYITLEGEELDKRKLLSQILYEEFSNNVMSLEVIKREFPSYDLELLRFIIREECKKCHYFINEYALLNLVLDIIIGMDRIKNERTFGSSRNEGKHFGIREQKLAQNIAAQIERNFNITYSPAELEELTIILFSHLLKVDFATLSIDNMENVVGKECVQIVKEIRALLKKTYYIDTNNKDFIVKFTLHIKNLLVRLENGYTTKNPLLNHIKNTCPLIFECAVEVADKLREVTKYDIKEDEIAYIALHIGGNLEAQKSKRKIVNCIILFPQYYDFSNKMIEKLKEHYGERVEITTVITSIDEIKDVKKADLVISTIPVSETIGKESVMITPFLSHKDFNIIEEKIQKINLKKKKAKLKKHLMQISNPKFFYKNMDFKNKQETIRFMTDVMKKEGYVEESYYDEVFDRENQASTAYEHIAVPHSMKMNAKKTGMFVLLNEKKPLEWDNHATSIVLLFAINEDERAIFYDVYDNLIVLLLEKLNAAKVIQCNTYIEFIEAVVKCFG
ncbi:BglG family transcription antiterminator [Vallitalea maricola]|uniref:PTS sugar transporter subunit IIA n=1 Tax=Vallitalea maricola TaxID=3074433 RepID=A0ACB5UH88_9FIRM|nr:PTS sugar transporter subunit IIA [Vallitalea sp. AN17-2]